MSLRLRLVRRDKYIQMGASKRIKVRGGRLGINESRAETKWYGISKAFRKYAVSCRLKRYTLHTICLVEKIASFYLTLCTTRQIKSFSSIIHLPLFLKEFVPVIFRPGNLISTGLPFTILSFFLSFIPSRTNNYIFLLFHAFLSFSLSLHTTTATSTPPSKRG